MIMLKYFCSIFKYSKSMNVALKNIVSTKLGKTPYKKMLSQLLMF